MRAIVTGAAQGIGECAARMLAQDDHSLVLADIQEKKVAAVVATYLKSLARREGFASELCSRCASPAKLAREEESHPEEDQ
jgi:NAD(P)-dependent dehydrogenase (short-subunit alcohol dehydrogenase family)